MSPEAPKPIDSTDNLLNAAGVHYKEQATAAPAEGMSTVMRMQQLALANIGIEFPKAEDPEET